MPGGIVGYNPHEVIGGPYPDLGGNDFVEYCFLFVAGVVEGLEDYFDALVSENVVDFGEAGVFAD